MRKWQVVRTAKFLEDVSKVIAARIDPTMLDLGAQPYTILVKNKSLEQPNYIMIHILMAAPIEIMDRRIV